MAVRYITVPSGYNASAWTGSKNENPMTLAGMDFIEFAVVMREGAMQGSTWTQATFIIIAMRKPEWGRFATMESVLKSRKGGGHVTGPEADTIGGLSYISATLGGETELFTDIAPHRLTTRKIVLHLDFLLRAWNAHYSPRFQGVDYFEIPNSPEEVQNYVGKHAKRLEREEVSSLPDDMKEAYNDKRDVGEIILPYRYHLSNLKHCKATDSAGKVYTFNGLFNQVPIHSSQNNQHACFVSLLIVALQYDVEAIPDLVS